MNNIERNLELLRIKEEIFALIQQADDEVVIRRLLYTALKYLDECIEYKNVDRILGVTD